MKKIFLKFISVLLLSTSLNAEITSFGTIGYAENNSATSKENFSFHFGVGYKYKDSKLYLTSDSIFYTKTSKEVSLLINSINYDHIYYRKSNFMFYGGVSTHLLIAVDTLDYNTDIEENFKVNKIAGGSTKTGILYKVNENFNIDFGIKYMYLNTQVNHELVRNTYGTYLNFEYDFFTYNNK